MVRTARDLGLIVRGERQRQRLDQQTLAERVGVSRQWIIAMEKGKPGAAVGLVLRTLNVLGLAVRVGPPGRGTGGLSTVSAALVDIDSVVEDARRGRK